MFKKDENGIYSLSGRFWIQAIVLLLLICAVGVSTQRTANKTEALSRETISYARQTNDCLSQLAATLKRRSELADSDSKLNADEREAIQTLFTDALDTNLADPNAKQSILNKYFSRVGPIREQRANNAQERANNTYPDPNCGNKLPGE